MTDLTDVYKPNELIGAFSQLELNRVARHLFNYFLRHAQHEIKFNNYQGNTFEISTVELNELAQLDRHDYAVIKNSLIKLMQPIILRDDPKQFKATVPLSDIDIDVAKGVYRFELNNTMLQLLKNVDYFTKLNLQELNPLRSKHSLIIFEYLKRYENAPKIPLLSVEDLRKMTDTLKSRSYDNFNNLKKYVIDVAVNEINEDKTDYICKYDIQTERTKRRPKVTAIQFYFSKKENTQKIIDVQINDSTSLVNPIIQDGLQIKDPMLMTANELYTVLSNCFSGLSWQEFCESTYIYDNLTIVYFAEWASTQTHKYHVSLYSQYLMDRSKDTEEYNNYRFRAQNITSNVIESYLLSNCNTPYEAENVKNMIMSNIYGRYHFDAFAQILSDILKQSCPNAKYDYFKVSYEREKHHINAK